MSRALVLGSGGQTGLGWEVGVLEGLSRSGVDLDRFDFVVGSSAGAIVGAWLRAGRLHETYVALTTVDPAVDRSAMAAGMGNSLPHLIALPGRAGSIAGAAWTSGAILRRLAGAGRIHGLRVLPEVWASLGQYLGPDALTAEQLTALAPISVGQRQRQLLGYEAYWQGRLGRVHEWPTGRLGIVAFCLTTGRRHVFEASSGVPLVRAIAASTAVPGIVGAVRIEGRQYVDAGPLDSTNLELVTGFDEVLVLAPDPNPGELDSGVRQLLSQGSRVTVVEPSDPSSFGAGIEHLDAMRAPAAAALGLRDGQAAALKNL